MFREFSSLWMVLAGVCLSLGFGLVEADELKPCLDQLLLTDRGGPLLKDARFTLANDGFYFLDLKGKVGLKIFKKITITETIPPQRVVSWCSRVQQPLSDQSLQLQDKPLAQDVCPLALSPAGSMDVSMSSGEKALSIVPFQVSPKNTALSITIGRPDANGAVADSKKLVMGEESLPSGEFGTYYLYGQKGIGHMLSRNDPEDSSKYKPADAIQLEVGQVANWTKPSACSAMVTNTNTDSGPVKPVATAPRSAPMAFFNPLSQSWRKSADKPPVPNSPPVEAPRRTGFKPFADRPEPVVYDEFLSHPPQAPKAVASEPTPVVTLSDGPGEVRSAVSAR